MNDKHQQLEQARQLLSENWKRGEQIINNAESYRDWPTNCDTRTILFAVELAINALDLIERSASAIGMRSESLHEPLSPEDFADIGSASDPVGVAGLSSEETLTLKLALARRLNATAGDLLRHAEACLEGAETLDGEPIHRSPLHDK